jgi:protein translocase, SecG subunit
MGVLSIILLVVFVIVCLLLVFLVAVQDENSVGIGGIFGGSSDSTFGSGTSSFINKATTILAIAFIVLALVIGVLNRTSNKDSVLAGQGTPAAAQSADGTWWTQNNAEATPAAN